MESSHKDKDKPSQEISKTNNEKKSAADIEKALRFWIHPSMATVPAEEKIQYLHSRGLSEEDIHQVWERLSEQQDTANKAPSNSAPPSSNTNEHYPQHSNYAYQEPDSSSAMDIPALLTIGGALGLTAAAAVRWLNGGDFCLLPPPTRNNIAVHEETRNVMHTADHAVDKEEEIAHDDNGLLLETDESSHPLDSTIDMQQQVMEMLEIHFAKQERMLQQISNHTTKQVTDQSMNLLRKNHAGNNNGVQRELKEIKKQLEKLSAGGVGNEILEKQLKECLNQLQECVKRVASEAGASIDGAEDNNSATCPSVPIGASSAFEPQSSIVVAPATTTVGEGSKSLLLREAIRTLAEQNEPMNVRTGAQLLYLYVINLSSHPHVPRYRKIFTTNESFQNVEQLQGGKELLIAVGFEEKGNCLEWQGGSDESDIVYLKEAAAALSILKSCSDDTNKQLSMNALSVLRPSTPPPVPQSCDESALQTPVFIASPPATKKHPLLDESGGEDSILDMSNISEHFESRLESLTQPAIMDDFRMFDDKGDDTGGDAVPRTNLSMRESDEVEAEGDEREDVCFESAQEDLKEGTPEPTDESASNGD